MNMFITPKIGKKTDRETIIIMTEQKENGYKFTYSPNFDQIKLKVSHEEQNVT